MGKEKRNKVMEILQRIPNGAVFASKDLDSVMGRLQRATSTCPLAKPLLQALWQWKGAVQPSGRPNRLARTFAKLPPTLPPTQPFLPPCPGGVPATPAQAKKAATWVDGSVTKIQSRKMMFCGSSSTSGANIPSLEMLGSLLLASFLMEKGVRNRLHFRIPLISNNQGNIFALNQSSRKMLS